MNHILPLPEQVELSIVAAAHDEVDNIDPLIRDVREAMATTGVDFELIIVDDGSTDGTSQRLQDQLGHCPWLHVLRLSKRGTKTHGQSAAFQAGIQAARGRLVALMDADRQNDPRDLPEMVRLLHAQHVDMVQGDRSANRRDSAPRRLASSAARLCRRLVIGDPIRDSGCSLRIMRREVALSLPLNYRGMHRYIPALARIQGFQIIQVAVRHRPRVAGQAKYGFLNRALPGFVDLLVVAWMNSRLVPIRAERVTPAAEMDSARAA